MSQNTVTQHNNNGSQSTAVYEFNQVFLGDNKFDSKTLTNTLTSATKTYKCGEIIVKTGATTIDALDVAANITNVIGVLILDADVELADNATRSINVCTKGLINESEIVLPSGVTLDTIIPTTNISLRDKLNDLGFHLETSVENTKQDNI